MRIRTIKPDWLEDEALVKSGSDARVLSVALILLSDDSGRGRVALSTPSLVFPEDSRVFHEALAKLRPWYVRLYKVRGQTYFAICNWSKHQRIDKPSRPHTPEPEEGEWLDSPDPRETLASIPGGIGSGREVEGKGREGDLEGRGWDENRFVELYLAWYVEVFGRERSDKPKPWDPTIGKLTLLAGSEAGFHKHMKLAKDDHYVIKSAGKPLTILESWDDIETHGPRDEFKNPIKPKAAKRRKEPVPAVLRPVEASEVVGGEELAGNIEGLLGSLVATKAMASNGGQK